MKLNRTITLCAIAAALALSAGTLLAQDDGGGPAVPAAQVGLAGLVAWAVPGAGISIRPRCNR